MLILAHRGYHAAVPENTLAAFEAAIALGVDGIETDVRISRDGLPVLIHNRVTSSGQAVADSSRSEIEQAEGHAVPTLEQVLERFPAMLWNIEIKTTQALPSVIEILAQYQANRRILVTSFRHDVVAECASSLKLDCGLLVAHRPRSLDSLLADPDHARINHLVWDYNIVDAALLKQAAAAGFRNFIYGPVTTAEHDYCRELGVDGVITDYPQRLLDSHS